MSCFLRWFTVYLVYFTSSEAPFQVKFWDLNSVILARQDLKTWHAVRLAHSHENRSRKVSQMQKLPICGKRKKHVWYHDLTANSTCRAAKMSISRSSKESSCGEDGQIPAFPGCIQILRILHKPENCGTSWHGQKMLTERSNPSQAPDLFSSRSSAVPAPMARCGLITRPWLINAESHLVREVHTNPPCTSGW